MASENPLDHSIEILLKGWLDGTLSAEQATVFFQAVRDQELSENLKTGDILQKYFANADSELPKSRLEEKELVLQRIREAIRSVPVIPVWKKFIAAAAVLLIIFTGAYFLLNKEKPVPENTVAKQKTNDVSAPTATHATILLAGGQKIVLDTASTGTLATQGNATLQKRVNGEIVYKGSENVLSETVYNTLNNPRGSRVVSIRLSDGTEVWLNAESTLKYPSAFSGKDRTVEITGEAYFEVAHNPQMPFKVKKDGVEVNVLGTHFNVNAYDDEKEIRVTLLEGSIELNTGSTPKILSPGQQGIVKENAITVKKDIDLQTVMAWKNGKFDFGEKASIGEVMRQLSRWYNVDVTYNGTVSRHFGGSISREVNISEVMKILELSGGIKYKIDGDKITVSPVD